jgi:predicted DNA-binding transcriptional regulator AlpA
MSKHDFTLILSSEDALTDAHLDSLFDQGCDDATFGEVDGVQFADLSRDAESVAAAIGSARRAVERAVPGLRVTRVEPDDLVSASEIAARLGRSRESIRLLIEGKRGPGSFPPPVSGVKAGRRIWRWSDVAEWCARNLDLDTPSLRDARFVAALNSALELRSLADGLTDTEQKREVAATLAGDDRLLPV